MTGLAIPASAAYDILPCAVGNKWQYDTVKITRASIQHQGRPLASMRDASSGLSTYEIASVDTQVNPAVYEYSETVTMRSGSGPEETDKVQLAITVGPDGMRILSTYQEPSGDEKPEKQIYDPPLLYYSPAAASGSAWQVGTTRDGETKTVLAARGANRETITVPAGTFKDCLKVIYSSDDISGTIQMWEKTFTITAGRSRGIYWIADGVGVVKELEVSTSIAETAGPDGKPVTVEAATCVVSELKPGYVVKK